MRVRWKSAMAEMTPEHLQSLKCCRSFQSFKNVSPGTLNSEAKMLREVMKRDERRSYLMSMRNDEGIFFFNGKHVFTRFSSTHSDSIVICKLSV